MSSQVATPTATAAANPVSTGDPNAQGLAARTPQAGVARSTPRRLRRMSLGLIAVGVAFGILASLTFVLLATALGRASASTAQLIRVQQIQTNLLAADATATNAFLVGGLEAPAQRSAYDAAINAATGLIAAAARAEPADEQALAALNEQLVSYVALIEDARSNNRQGFPVGAQYQRIASSSLRADALPLLDNLVTANAERARSQMGPWQIAILVVAGLGALGVMILAQSRLAKQFRRRINPFVLAASILIAVAWIAGMIAVGATGAAVNRIQNGSFADVNAVASARIEGFDAKSNESLTLIARGSGAAFEKAWQESATEVGTSLANLPAPLRTAWQGYVGVHGQIRALDDSGKWDQAVQRATGTGADSSNTTFGAFDRASAEFLTQATGETERGLDGSRIGLVLGAVLSLLVGLVAAVLARHGIEARLREYR